MTLDEAIEYLTNFIRSYEMSRPGNFGNAVMLGIEALKAHKQRREYPMSNWSYLLPGETGD